MHASPTEPLPVPERHLAGGVTVYVNPAYDGQVNLDDLFELPRALQSLPGRSTRRPDTVSSWAWRPDWHEGPGLAVRQYVHGGFLGRLAGSLFPGPGRMLREFRLAAYAHSEGVPTALPVALRVERAFAGLVRAHYVSRLIADSTNLLELVRQAEQAGRLAELPRRRLAEAVADAVAAVHEAGIVHADLNVKNLLVVGAFDEPRVFVIDFDQARLMDEPPLRRRMGNLMRLDRSIVKWGATRRAVGLLDRIRTLRAYLERYPEWRGSEGRIARRYGSRHLRHYASRRAD
jgi:3-deoxy-D-manno-octulosonic acid kinase